MGWVPFSAPIAHTLTQTPRACFLLLLLPPEGLKVPSPSSRPQLQQVCKHPLPLALHLGGSLTNPCGGWLGKHDFESPLFGAPLRKDGDERVLIP